MKQRASCRQSLGPFLCVWAYVAILVCAASLPAVEPERRPADFRFQEVSEKSLGLWQGDKPVLVYNHGAIARPEITGSRPRACYFHPVYGLNGEVITDDFPKDHTYHRGMYWAWPHIKIGDREYDLWSARGELRQVFGRWLTKEASSGNAVLAVENHWVADGKPLVREQMKIEVQPESALGRALDLTLTWVPLEQSLTLWGAEGKSYGGFNFRFGPRTKTIIKVPENTVLPEGIVADAGRVSGDLVVTRAPWIDLVGDFGKTELSGAAVFVHPQHADYPPTWMARHYGLVSVGWPGVESQTFLANTTITCRYRIWIHRGEVATSAIQSEYADYVALANRRATE
jgi:hypothetical protein